MDKKEYFDRYEARMIKKGVPPEFAKAYRNSAEDEIEVDDWPEGAADEEMSYWEEEN